MFRFVFAFLSLWQSLLFAEPCTTALLLPPQIMDPQLVSALKALSKDERSTVHVPELEKPFQTLREMTATKTLVSKDRFLAYMDQMAATKQITYTGFWYATFLSLALRGVKKNKLFPPVSAWLRTRSSDSAIFAMGDAIDPYRAVRLSDSISLVFGFLRDHLYLPFQSDDLFIPMVDPAEGPQVSTYKSGQFAESYTPNIYPIGISREDKNEFDGFHKMSALETTLHDFFHADEMRKAFVGLSSPLRRPRTEELAAVHRAFLNAISQSPADQKLLQQYDTFLHETPENTFKIISICADPVLWAHHDQNLFLDGVALEGPLKKAKLCDGQESVCFAQPVLETNPSPWPSVLKYWDPKILGQLPLFGVMVQSSISNGDPLFAKKIQEFHLIQQTVNALLAHNPGAVVRYSRKTDAYDVITSEQIQSLPREETQ